MDSSQSAVISSILTVASFTNERISLFLNLLIGLSSILFAVIAGTFGLSWWKQNELKKEAERDARRINALAGKTLKLYEEVQKNMRQTASYVKAAEELVKHVSEQSSKLEPLLADVEKKGKQATNSVEEIKRIRMEIERANQSLGTISQYAPSASGPTVGTSLSDILTEYGPSANADAVSVADLLRRGLASKK